MGKKAGVFLVMKKRRKLFISPTQHFPGQGVFTDEPAASEV